MRQGSLFTAPWRRRGAAHKHKSSCLSWTPRGCRRNSIAPPRATDAASATMPPYQPLRPAALSASTWPCMPGRLGQTRLCNKALPSQALMGKQSHDVRTGPSLKPTSGARAAPHWLATGLAPDRVTHKRQRVRLGRGLGGLTGYNAQGPPASHRSSRPGQPLTAPQTQQACARMCSAGLKPR